jgi:hypothetical protein
MGGFCPLGSGSPLLEKDALKMQNIYNKVEKNRKKGRNLYRIA